MPLYKAKNNGFTLVEMSIVILIISLVIGGIISGKALIRSAELNSISAKAAEYDAAINTFRLKYHGLPGDIIDANDYWAAAANGDANGKIEFYAEVYSAWEHLSLAELIDGSYDGVAGGTTISTAIPIPENNVPEGPLVGSIYMIASLSEDSSVDDEFGFDDGVDLQHNFIFFGKGGGGDWTLPILSAADAYSIDRKSDDGLPAYGRIRGGARSACTNGVNVVSVYNSTDSDTISCQLGFIITN